MRQKPCLSSEDVEQIVAAAKKYAAKIKRKATIAVVDEAGHLLYLERPDVNGVNTVDMALAKGRTAAYRGRPSSAFGKRVQERIESLTAPNYLGVPGGVPILYEKLCLGGIGVSGIDHDDEPVAEAGAEGFDPPKAKKK
jgi:glc operon protein GlcG